MRVTFSRRADRDLERLLFDLQDRAGLRVAYRTVDRIERRSQTLAELPERGPRLRYGDDDDLRYLIETPYLIVYRVGVETIEIVAVVHGSRDIVSALGGDDDS